MVTCRSLETCKKSSIPVHTSSRKSRALSPKPTISAEGAGLSSVFGCALAVIAEYFQYFLRVGAEGNVNENFDPARHVRARPVDELFGHEVAVRYDDLGAIERPDGASADTDAGHDSEMIFRFDAIADFDRSFEDQNQSRDEVADDVLEAEADADPQRAENNGELRRAEPTSGSRQ